MNVQPVHQVHTTSDLSSSTLICKSHRYGFLSSCCNFYGQFDALLGKLLIQAPKRNSRKEIKGHLRYSTMVRHLLVQVRPRRGIGAALIYKPSCLLYPSVRSTRRAKIGSGRGARRDDAPEFPHGDSGSSVILSRNLRSCILVVYSRIFL